MKPNLFMIGGANGAGKTTAAMTLLSHYLDVFEFVNADEIAHGLNPLKPATANIMAGRVMLDRIDGLIKSHTHFAFETTCAGHHHVKTLRQAKAAGYLTTLIFLWLPSADMAVQRVRSRVKQGGHAIPEATIRRRYIAGLKNLVALFLHLVDRAVIYDSTALVGTPAAKIAEKTEFGLTIIDSARWQQINISIRE